VRVASHATASPHHVDDVLSRADKAGVRYVDLQFTDVMGVVKTVTIPADQLRAAFEHGTWFDGSSVESFARTAESDMYLVPDPGTFRIIPWTGTPPTARLICWAHTPEGEPYPGDPRGALRRAVEAAAQLGFDYRCGPEIEFFLLREDESGRPVPLPHDRGGYFDFSTDQSVGVRHAMVSAIQALGIEVNAAHHEVAAGQHEIDFTHASALKAADDVITFRYTLRAVAQQAGLTASFMPKPFIDCNGSGMHVHQSLAALPDLGNAFADSADEYGLSDLAKHFIAGQLHHAAGMCAVLAPLVNSYKRLVRGFEAPVMVSWARTNRGALIRVPHTPRREGTRVELRSPDPSCNPYLALAVMLRCGLDGIERRLPLPPPVEESLYGFDDTELERRNVGLLPDNLKDAVTALRHDDVVLDALGDHLAERFMEAKGLEYREYRRQVTPWELERYLELL
jgi:glutamine synthetase